MVVPRACRRPRELTGGRDGWESLWGGPRNNTSTAEPQGSTAGLGGKKEEDGGLGGVGISGFEDLSPVMIRSRAPE